MKKVLIVVNVGWFFISHRLPIALAAKEAGYEVHVAAALDPEFDQNTAKVLADQQLIFHELRFSRSGSGPFELARDVLDLLRLYKRVSPDIVHLVTIKPVLLGGLCARLLRVPGIVLAIPGRGSVFSARGAIGAIRRALALLMYRSAYVRGRSKVIIQNVEDREYFVSRGVFAPYDVRLVRGSGVDLARFEAAPEPQATPLVVLASRMLREKGISDFVDAARELKGRGVEARFALIGEPDRGNPKSHTKEELGEWARSGVVEWWGFRKDIHSVFAEAHVVCLPTYYGEGVPKVLIEAAACGRPIVTTDTPGCRDIVRQGDNGLLVPPRNVAALAEALELLISQPLLRSQMGARGRARVEAEFGVDAVVGQTLEIYAELGR